MPLPFDDSRRLTGSNLHFPATGAVLELVGLESDDALVEDWRSRVALARAHLGWNREAPCVLRRHASGTSLAIAAPFDQLFTATEINEWALCAALQARDPSHWQGLREALGAAAAAADPNPGSVLPPEIETGAALARFSIIAAAEARPALVALHDAAAARELPVILDEETLTIGSGRGGRGYALDRLPAVDEVPWSALRAMPTALVTGSNGKTTTVRLIAACAEAQGWRAGYCCTDGVFVAGDAVEAGDYSGPVGARSVLREPRVGAAVLETARGGILRRGLATTRADVAVVTNVSADHFGEYGIHDLASLADVKLTVGSVLGTTGLLVLNGDDPVLRARAPELAARCGFTPTIGWFAAEFDDPFLREARDSGQLTCGVRGGRLMLGRGGRRVVDRDGPVMDGGGRLLTDHGGVGEHDLGAIAELPLTAAGRASYNVANLSAAALAAVGLGIAPAVVAQVYARFGARNEDNPGRLMRFDANGVRVLVDYAHNPEGLAGLLRVAEGLRGAGGRLGLLLGHAGNRGNRDIERLAEVAAGFGPSLVVLKELEGYRRGRAPGEVPQILHDALLRAGLPASAVMRRESELDAVRCALAWARPGDVLALPVHGLAARAEVLALLDGAKARA